MAERFQYERMVNTILYFVQNVRPLPKTKLFKLLAYADFESFRLSARTITGMKYNALPYGPVPQELFSDISNRPERFAEHFKVKTLPTAVVVFEPVSTFNADYFSKIEIDILKKTAEIFNLVSTDDAVDASHDFGTPWEVTKRTKGLNQPIDLMLALDYSKPGTLPEELVLEMMHTDQFFASI
jgi:uncharacterized phage-associated protein